MEPRIIRGARLPLSVLPFLVCGLAAGTSARAEDATSPVQDPIAAAIAAGAETATAPTRAQKQKQDFSAKDISDLLKQDNKPSPAMPSAAADSHPAAAQGAPAPTMIPARAPLTVEAINSATFG